jgi:eukaryotic-like serine/threonine-protein kinase
LTLREPLQQALGTSFVIERELTGGGMAHLYVVLDTSLNRRVVVKVLPRERAEGVSAERFRGEIRTVAALQHPNIVGILAAGEVEGLPYYIMPFIDGESLRGLLEREGRMSPRAAVALLRDVARACAYAHARGIVHRDIKPDNVLLSGGAALITDFGIAKALSAAQRPVGDSTLTRDGFTVGTPRYMAPEQLAGDPNIDYRVDFYAMGVMAYEMLTGQVPFSNPTPRALLAAQLSEPPTPLRQIRPEIPIRLARLVADCLLKDPAQRPASAEVILAALDDPALLSDEFRAAPTVTLEPPRRSNRLRTTILAVGALAVLGGAVLLRPGAAGTSGASAGARAASVALLPLVDESPDSSAGYLANGLTERLTAALASVHGLQVAPRSGAERYRATQPPTDIGRDLGVETLWSGKIKRIGSRLEVTTTLVEAKSGKELSSGRVEGDVADLPALEANLAADAAAALGKEFGALPRPALGAPDGFHNPLAYDHFLQGRYLLQRGAGAGLQQALQQFGEARALDSLSPPVYAGLAETYLVLASSGAMSPDAALPRAVASAEKAVALDSASAGPRVMRGRVFNELWRWSEAERDFRRAVALDSADPLARLGLGRSLLLAGEVDAAEHELGVALALDRYSADIAGLEGIALVLLGRGEKGIETARRAVDLEPGLPGPRLLLGTAYLYGSRPFDAVFTLAGAVELDPTNPQVLGMLGYAYAIMGQAAKGRVMLTRLTRSEQRAGALAAMARIHIGLGQPDEALGLLERAAAAHDPMFASESLYTPIFDPLKQHPRFQRLLERLGLTPMR